MALCLTHWLWCQPEACWPALPDHRSSPQALSAVLENTQLPHTLQPELFLTLLSVAWVLGGLEEAKWVEGKEVSTVDDTCYLARDQSPSEYPDWLVVYMEGPRPVRIKSKRGRS